MTMKPEELENLLEHTQLNEIQKNYVLKNYQELYEWSTKESKQRAQNDPSTVSSSEFDSENFETTTKLNEILKEKKVEIENLQRELVAKEKRMLDALAYAKKCETIASQHCAVRDELQRSFQNQKLELLKKEKIIEQLKARIEHEPVQHRNG